MIPYWWGNWEMRSWFFSFSTQLLLISLRHVQIFEIWWRFQIHAENSCIQLVHCHMVLSTLKRLAEWRQGDISTMTQWQPWLMERTACTFAFCNVVNSTCFRRSLDELQTEYYNYSILASSLLMYHCNFKESKGKSEWLVECEFISGHLSNKYNDNMSEQYL